MDILNPELIVIGSIYSRNEDMMKPFVDEVLAREALPLANKVCKVVPAALGESIGDYAALSVAANIPRLTESLDPSLEYLPEREVIAHTREIGRIIDRHRRQWSPDRWRKPPTPPSWLLTHRTPTGFRRSTSR